MRRLLKPLLALLFFASCSKSEHDAVTDPWFPFLDHIAVRHSAIGPNAHIFDVETSLEGRTEIYAGKEYPSPRWAETDGRATGSEFVAFLLEEMFRFHGAEFEDLGYFVSSDEFEGAFSEYLWSQTQIIWVCGGEVSDRLCSTVHGPFTDAVLLRYKNQCFQVNLAHQGEVNEAGASYLQDTPWDCDVSSLP